MARAKVKSQKKFAPKLKAVIQRRKDTAKIREAKRERADRRNAPPKKERPAGYKPEVDFDTGKIRFGSCELHCNRCVGFENKKGAADAGSESDVSVEEEAPRKQYAIGV